MNYPGSDNAIQATIQGLATALVERISDAYTNPFALSPLAMYAVRHPEVWVQVFAGMREDYQWDFLTTLREISGNPLTRVLIAPLAQSPAQLTNVGICAMIADIADRDWQQVRQWMEQNASLLDHYQRREAQDSVTSFGERGSQLLQQMSDLERAMTHVREREAEWANLSSPADHRSLVQRYHQWSRQWLQQEIGLAITERGNPQRQEAMSAARSRLSELTAAVRSEHQEVEQSLQQTEHMAQRLRSEMERMRQRQQEIQTEIIVIERELREAGSGNREAENRLAGRRREIEDLRRAATSENAEQILRLLDQIYALLPNDGADEGLNSDRKAASRA